MKLTGTQRTLTVLLGVTLLASLAVAQGDYSQFDSANINFRVTPSSVFNESVPLIRIDRNIEEKDFQGIVVDNALNFNLGLKVEPLPGLSVRADAWQLEINEIPAVAVSNSDWPGGLPQLYIEDSDIHEFNLDNPLLGSSVESNGFDLGASYVWETSRFGQFTLSTKATYVEEFENKGSLLDLLGAETLGTEMNGIEDRVISPELQSSLMLTWQFGNHTASAITNYFDSYKDISELDIEEINDLVDNITTVDLKYGYSVEAGSNRAVISFGIRNIFDEKTAQILNSTTRVLDQNGRVAYGSIKYQF